MPDRTKYLFNGKEYGKGPTVLEVIRKYLEDHPEADFNEVRQVFPDDLQKGSTQFSKDGQCVVKKLAEVKDKARFFINEKDQLKTKGSVIVVSREWNIDNFAKFRKRAQELGYEISAQS